MTILDRIDVADGAAPEVRSWLEREAWRLMCDGQGRRDWLEEVLGVGAVPDWRFGLRLGIAKSLSRFQVGVGLVELELAEAGATGLAGSCWQPVETPPAARYGATAVTVPVWQCGVVAGLLALHPERGERWVSRTGDVPDMLGLAVEDLPDCRQVLEGAPLRVCRTPLRWLRHLVGAHRAWQQQVRLAWPQIVRDGMAGPVERAGGWRGLRWAPGWMWHGEWRRHPAVPPEPGPRDAVCLLRPELAERAFAGLGVPLVCDSPGHAKALGEAMAAQRRRRRAAEPALPDCQGAA